MNMSAIEPCEGQYHTPTASHHALQVALQTLRERCQVFQKRLVTLEQENQALRAAQGRSSTAIGLGQFRERQGANASQTEVELLRESVSELTRQKTQLADHISMVATENRQLWRRLSQIAKDIPSSFADGNGDVNAGYNYAVRSQVSQHEQQRTSSSNNQPGQSLIRSRTFTKNAPNPKLRERLQRDGSSEEELLNLEDISLLNTCGFLETVGGDLLQLSVLGQQDEELLAAALEANPDIRRCIEGLSNIRHELIEQESALKDLFNAVEVKKSQLCNECQNRQASTSKKLMKDVTVEVAESELPPIEDVGIVPGRASGSSQSNNEYDEPVTSDPKAGTQIDLLLQEKLRDNCGMEKICPMCGNPYGAETVFDDFRQHVESHFLDDSEMGELSLDRTYEYVSQTVGNF